MPNSGLAIAAVAALSNAANINVTPALAVKRGGTWVQVGTAPGGSNWTRSSADIVFTQELSISNNSGSDQSFTDGAVIASQDLGQTITLLNTDESAVDNLIGPIEPLPSQPITVQNGQTLRFTELRISL